MRLSTECSVDTERTATSGKVPLNVVLADDHRMVLSALRHLIAARPEYRILAEVRDIGELMSLPELPRADVVVLDLNLPMPAGEVHSAELPGLKALPRLRKLTQAKCLVLSMHDESAVVLRALHLGASGFVTKSSPAERLFEALDAVNRGVTFVDPAILGAGLQTPSGVLFSPIPEVEPRPEALLSRQEKEVAHLLLTGMTQKAISHRLGVSPQTTHTYKRRLKEKLDVSTDVDLLRKLTQLLG